MESAAKKRGLIVGYLADYNGAKLAYPQGMNRPANQFLPR